MILCWFCKRGYPREDWIITNLADGRLYGGGGLYRAIHRRCKKHTYLPSQTAKNITQRERAGVR